MKHILLLFIAALFVLISCKKDKPDPAPIPVKEYYMDESLRAYFSFKPGTFWVYRDSITGQYDTVSVQSHNMGLANAAPFYPEKPEKYEYGFVILKHSHYPKPSNYRFQTFGNYIEYFSEYQTSCIIFADPDIVIVDVNGDSASLGPERTVSSGNFTFSKGVHIDSIAAKKFPPEYPSPPGQWSKYTYFRFTHARDVGIIKRAIKNDSVHQVWELVDYKIVR